MATTYPVLRWQIGDVRISRIVESEGPTPASFLFADATPEKLLQHAWLKPHFLTDDGKLISSIHAFVVESQGRVIVVDTCIGNDKPREVKNWHMRKGRFLEDMMEAGFARERVTTVLCTHLHVDHVGWNTMLKDGQWVPTFPNARYLFGKTEIEYWSTHAAAGDHAIQTDSVRPILEAGLATRLRHHLGGHPRTYPRPHAWACERTDQLKGRGSGDYRRPHASPGAVRHAGDGIPLRRGSRRRAGDAARIPGKAPGHEHACAGDALRGADRGQAGARGKVVPLSRRLMEFL
jgi:hypothetical protein